MTVKKTFCFCFSLRAGCIIIGGLCILVDISGGITIKLANYPYQGLIPFIINFISNVLLVIGEVTGKRDYLLPWMILGGLQNAVLWILAIVLLFRSTAAMTFASPQNEGAGFHYVIVFAILLALIATVHLLIIRNVFQHYNELGDENQNGNFQPSATTSILMPDAAPPVYTNAPVPYGQV